MKSPMVLVTMANHQPSTNAMAVLEGHRIHTVEITSNHELRRAKREYKFANLPALIDGKTIFYGNDIVGHVLPCRSPDHFCRAAPGPSPHDSRGCAERGSRSTPPRRLFKCRKR